MSSNEGEKWDSDIIPCQLDSDTVPYQLDSNTIPYNKPEEEENPQREELRTLPQPQRNGRKPARYRND